MVFPQSLRRKGNGKYRISGKTETEAKAKTLIGKLGRKQRKGNCHVCHGAALLSSFDWT